VGVPFEKNMEWLNTKLSSNIYHQMICVCTSFFGQKRFESYHESNQIDTFFKREALRINTEKKYEHMCQANYLNLGG
jgi:hypothetical protein